ncbi:MAG: hypothetical protein OHK0052_14930 [Anaerolineales bacterium]
MKLAINYSRTAASLLQRGAIDLHRFKTPPWRDMIAEASQYKPVAVHFDLVAGNGSLQNADWQLVEHLLQTTETAYVNLHLIVRHGDLPDVPIENPSAAHIRAVTDAMLTDVLEVTRRFGASNVIVENSPYAPVARNLVSACVLPQVITEVVQTANCGLLFDLSHARIAADGLGVDAHTYIESLPLHALRELHFTGIHTLPNGRLQDHLAATPADWVELDWLLQNLRDKRWQGAQPHMLAFEYGGEGGEFFRTNCSPETIAHDMPQLWQRVAQISQ